MITVQTQPSIMNAQFATTERRTPIILCIDDNPDIAHAIELHLRQFDVEVSKASHGMQGYAMARQHEPDLIVLDIGLPNGNGPMILEELRSHSATSQTPVIILSGMRDRAMQTRMYHLGANRYLTKPIHCNALLAEMSRLVELREVEKFDSGGAEERR
jgi:DNA-binding response OmpR family regulator